MYRRVLKTVGVVGGTTTASAIAIGVYSSYRINSKRQRCYTDSFHPTPEFYRMPFRKCMFQTKDGVDLNAWYIPQTRRGKLSNRIIVLLHPYNSSKSNCLPIARSLWESGYSVFMTDFRSFAEKPTKQSIGYYEQRDARAALQYVRNVLGSELDSPFRIGLFGASMGGAVALLVSHSDESIRAVVTDCAFSSLRQVISHQMRVMFPFVPDIILRMSEMSMELFNIAAYDYSLDEIEPVNCVSSKSSISHPPLLLIHAEDDETVRHIPFHNIILDPSYAHSHTRIRTQQLQVTLDHGRKLFESAAVSDKDLWVVPNTQHIGAYFRMPLEYSKRVVQFYDRTLCEDE